jgi:hypothetical protein
MPDHFIGDGIRVMRVGRRRVENTRGEAVMLPIKQALPIPIDEAPPAPENAREIIAIGPRMLADSDWRHPCFFRGTDGRVICDRRGEKTD